MKSILCGVLMLLGSWVYSQNKLEGWDLILPLDFDKINVLVNQNSKTISDNRISEISFVDSQYLTDSTFKKFNHAGLIIEDNEVIVKLANMDSANFGFSNKKKINRSYVDSKKYEYDNNNRISKEVFYSNNKIKYCYEIKYSEKDEISTVNIIKPQSDKIELKFTYDTNNVLTDIIAKRGGYKIYTMHYYNLYDIEQKRVVLRRLYFNDLLLKETDCIDSTLIREKTRDQIIDGKENWIYATTLFNNSNEKIEISQQTFEIKSPEVYVTFIKHNGDEIKSYQINMDTYEVDDTIADRKMLEPRQIINNNLNVMVEDDIEVYTYYSNKLLLSREHKNQKSGEVKYKVKYRYSFYKL
jgi:hypothetical protein